MRKVTRDELMDLQRYEEERDAYRQRLFAIKAPRRIHLGPHLTYLVENADTIRYQVQEMCRAERLWKDADIDRELRTYNALLGGDGELGCTLMIEISDPVLRGEKLVAWRELPDHLYVRLEDGTRVAPTIDEAQRDTERLSAVQFLLYATKGRVPVAMGVDFGDWQEEVVLDETQRAALAADLS